MRKFLVSLIALVPLSGFSQNPIVTDIINDISIDTLIYYSEDISGDRAVTVNGSTDTIFSRHMLEPGNEIAYRYIMKMFESYGLQTDSMLFGTTGKNALAIQPGSVYPNQWYLVCGHYDALPYPGLAPAADDDGSGTAAVLEAARVLSGYEFEYTIIYAIWDEEEQGLVGSAAYASQANINADSLLGVLNLDAIAYDGDGDDLARVHTRPVANSEALADTVVAVNATYGIGLNMVINNPGATYSDHASFWNTGFSAVLIIEDFDNDGNPGYHTVNDVVANFDVPYFEKLAKVSLASLATLAIPIGPVGMDEDIRKTDFKIFPNPTEGFFQIEVELNANTSIDVKVIDQEGRLVYTSVEQGISGLNRISADLSNLARGTYYVSISYEIDHQAFRREKNITLVR